MKEGIRRAHLFSRRLGFFFASTFKTEVLKVERDGTSIEVYDL